MLKSLTAAALLSAATLPAATLPATAARMGPPPVEEMVARFDTDGSGSLDAKELMAARLDRFAAADADGDGFLTTEEMAAARDQAKERRRQARLDRMVARLDSDGDGKISAAEFLVVQERRMARIDTNGDGELNEDEIAAAMDAVRGRAPGRR